MRTRKQTVHANPYAHIDANGRLAGATPMGELPRSTSTPPVREYVGATRVLLDLDKAGRGVGASQLPRAEYMWKWSGEPVVVDATGPLGAYYQQRIASGEVFAASEKDGLPLVALARARKAALEQFKAEQGQDADTSEWAEQFPLDDQVEAAMALVAEADVRAATIAKAKADETAAASGAAADKAKADREANRTKAREKATAAARRALGVSTTPAPPSNADPAPDAGPGVTPALAKAVSGSASAKKETDR